MQAKRRRFGTAYALLLLPEGAETVKIDGGNHASVGTYGPQSGDGESIIPAHQHEQTADAIDRFIKTARI